jgi:hypothetical protein
MKECVILYIPKIISTQKFEEIRGKKEDIY